MGSVRGRELRCRVAPRGGALDRGSARTAQRVVSVFSSVRANTPVTQSKTRTPWSGRSWRFAVKRGSTRDPLEVIDRRWIGRGRNRTREGTGRTLRSGIGQSRGCS